MKWKRPSTESKTVSYKLLGVFFTWERERESTSSKSSKEENVKTNCEYLSFPLQNKFHHLHRRTRKRPLLTLTTSHSWKIRRRWGHEPATKTWSPPTDKETLIYSQKFIECKHVKSNNYLLQLYFWFISPYFCTLLMWIIFS